MHRISLVNDNAAVDIAKRRPVSAVLVKSGRQLSATRCIFFVVSYFHGLTFGDS